MQLIIYKYKGVLNKLILDIMQAYKNIYKYNSLMLICYNKCYKDVIKLYFFKSSVKYELNFININTYKHLMSIMYLVPFSLFQEKEKIHNIFVIKIKLINKYKIIYILR